MLKLLCLLIPVWLPVDIWRKAARFRRGDDMHVWRAGVPRRAQLGLEILGWLFAATLAISVLVDSATGYFVATLLIAALVIVSWAKKWTKYHYARRHGVRMRDLPLD